MCQFYPKRKKTPFFLARSTRYHARFKELGRAVASVPTTNVMDGYNAWAGILNAAVPNKLFSTVNPLDAQAAA